MSTCTVGQQQMPVGLGQGQASYVQPQAAAPAQPSIYDMYLEAKHPGIYRIADGGTVDATGQYVKSKDSAALCNAHVFHCEEWKRAFSVAGTNFIWKVLTEEVRQPLSADKSPVKCQQVFDKIKSFLKYDFAKEPREDMWKRTQNLFRKYFLSEVGKIGRFLSSKGYDKSKAIQAIASQPNSLADAIACEANRQFQLAQNELIARSTQMLIAAKL